jgi:hypothetical protein
MTVFDHTSENVQNDCREWPEAARQAWLEAFDPDNACCVLRQPACPVSVIQVDR